MASMRTHSEYSSSMQHWSKVEHPAGEPRPVERSRHAAACVGYGEDCPQLLIIGGFSFNNVALNDVWLLDVESGHWREVFIDQVY